MFIGVGLVLAGVHANLPRMMKQHAQAGLKRLVRYGYWVIDRHGIQAEGNTLSQANLQDAQPAQTYRNLE